MHKRTKQRLLNVAALFCATLFLGLYCLGLWLKNSSSAHGNRHSETQVVFGQLQATLALPSIRRELDLGDEQIAKLNMISPNPFQQPFGEAIKPIKEILDPWQFDLYLETVYQSLMVRAFSINLVREALALTPDQIEGISTIQANLKTRLQPFQDRLKLGKPKDIVLVESDTASFHDEAYLAALGLLTEEQYAKWRSMSKSVPLRNRVTQ